MRSSNTRPCLALTTLLILFHAHLSTSSSSLTTSDLFENWCLQHGKTYSSDQEKLHRFRVFEDNYAYVTNHNSMSNSSSSSYTLSLNAFADLTVHEFRASRLGLSVSAAASDDLIRGLNRGGGTVSGGSTLVGDPPSSLDWRTKGAVTPVKDQGSCGACWSFSSTGAMEGVNKIVTGSLISLSEQELVDCDRTFNNGCGGGLMDYVYQFVIKNKGIDSEEDYPFQAREGTCNKNKLTRHVVTIDGYTDIPQKDEKALLKAVATQPVSVGICGSDRAFQLYSQGIFTGPCSTSLDHAVLIVGYDSKDRVDYWIVKNSWGKSWGIDGYIHMARNTGNPVGVCGINMMASYPTKTSPNPPPTPPPGPNKCSLLTSCPPDETCCCGQRLFGFCLLWKCCELTSAVCCKDGKHCCPGDYPICDTRRDQCLKRTGNVTLVKELRKKGVSGKFGGWSFLLEQLNL